MKRRFLIAILLMTACVVLLNQCTSKDMTFRGQVMAVQNDSGDPRFLLRTNTNKDIIIDTNDRTFLHSWVEGIEAEALIAGQLEQPVVQAYITARPTRAKWEDQHYKAYRADQVILLSVLEREAYTLPDGTNLNIRRHHQNHVYETADGVSLLSEQIPTGPGHVYVGGQLSLDDLAPSAQKQILSWYKNRGLMYDLDERIQAAYDSYNRCEKKEEFQHHYVAQETFPNAYNEDLIWFASNLTATLDDRTGQEQRTCSAFRRDTGEHVPLEDLFSCPPEDIGNLVLDAADTAPEDLAAMKEAFRLEYLVFHSGALEIWFPTGTLPNYDCTCLVGADYENLTGILHPWAVPTPSE